MKWSQQFQATAVAYMPSRVSLLISRSRSGRPSVSQIFTRQRSIRVQRSVVAPAVLHLQQTVPLEHKRERLSALTMPSRSMHKSQPCTAAREEC